MGYAIRRFGERYFQRYRAELGRFLKIMDRSTTVAQFRRPSLHNRLVSRASLGGSFSGRRMGHQQRLDRVRWIASTMDDRYTVPWYDSPLRRGCVRSHLESQSQRRRADRDVCPRPELKAGVWPAPASSVSRPTGMPHKNFVSRSRRASPGCHLVQRHDVANREPLLRVHGDAFGGQHPDNQPGYLASLRHYPPALTLTWRIRGRTCRKRIASGRAPARKGV
jgi:hypothetical protein